MISSTNLSKPPTCVGFWQSSVIEHQLQQENSPKDGTAEEESDAEAETPHPEENTKNFTNV